MRRRPVVTLRMKDHFGSLVSGGAVHMYNLKYWSIDVADGQAPWHEPPVNDGKIIVTLPEPGDYI